MPLCSLSQDIQHSSEKLLKLVAGLPPEIRTVKMIDGTGGKVSVADLVAYQIGWGKAVIRWYQEGLVRKIPKMPGDGFLKWDYVPIAKHFYEKYRYDADVQQMDIFQQVVSQLLSIVEKEHHSDQLDKTGIWDWCTLSSGIKWPLSKWIKVNSSSPYKRAVLLIKKAKLLAC